MENPATWGAAERVVHDVITEHFAHQDAGETLCGLSLERQITDAMRKAGLIEVPAEDGVSDASAMAALDAWYRGVHGKSWSGKGGRGTLNLMKDVIRASRDPGRIEKGRTP